MMLRAQKIELGKTITKIISGNFGLSDVKNLFMDLRPYADKDAVFLEYADFVAHPGRCKGLIHKALEYHKLKARYISEFLIKNNQIDYTEEFPAYIKEMFKYIALQIKPDVLRAFRLTQLNLSNFVNQKVVSASLDRCELSSNIKKLIKDGTLVPELHVLVDMLDGFEDPPAITQRQLTDALIRVLQTNKVAFNEDAFRKQFDNIAVLIIAHLHKSCYTMSDKSEITILIKGMEWRYENVEGEQMIKSKFLHLSADLSTDDWEHENGGVPGFFSPTIITTKLDAYNWCNPLCFVDFGEAKGGLSDHDFQAKGFKLHPILPYEGKGVADVSFSV